MSYDLYMDGILYPVPPSKISIKVNNQNKTLNLINEGEINLLKQAGLTDISFTIMLPQVRYPFATYTNGFQRANFYLEKLENLKVSQEPFRFIFSRALPNGELLFDTNMKVSMEDFKTSEDAKNGFDINVEVSLKQYREYSTKTVQIKPPTLQKKAAATVQKTRPAETAPKAKTHSVVKGDCLWNIAKKYYGNGSLYTKIADANKDKIKSPNLILPGQVLTIP